MDSLRAQWIPRAQCIAVAFGWGAVGPGEVTSNERN
jgi:hypothetical protein